MTAINIAALIAAALFAFAARAGAQISVVVTHAGENPDTGSISIMLGAEDSSELESGEAREYTTPGGKAGKIIIKDVFEGGAVALVAEMSGPGLAAGDALLLAPKREIGAGAVVAENPTQTLRSSAHKIGPEDVLQIKSFPVGQLPDIVTVRPDGTLSLPHVGVFKAAGLTVFEAGDVIQERMKEYFKRPWVEVTLEKQKTERVKIFGEVTVSHWRVSGPGEYELPKPTRLTDFIATVGGLTERADRKNIKIMRPDGEETTANLDDATANLLSDANPVLYGGELVYAPAAASRQTRATVLGRVGRQGIVHLDSENAFLTEAISSSGGISPDADVNGIIVVRTIDGQRVSLKVNFKDILSGKTEADFALAADDVIFIAPAADRQRAVDKFNSVIKDVLPTMNLLLLLDRLSD